MSAQSTGQRELLSNQDLADLMGWAVKTVHMRRYRGQSLPPSIVTGRTIRYRREAVDRWLDELEKPAAIGMDNVFDSRTTS